MNSASAIKWTPELYAECQRQFASRALAPFIMYMMPSYLMGWVHKIICIELDKFLQAVVNRQSPRLIITMPPRHMFQSTHP